MKTILSVILCASLVSSSVVAAPVFKTKPSANSSKSIVSAGDIFGRINAHRQQNGISLNWVVLNSADVSGFAIERSWDGVYFDVIATTPVTDGTNHYMDNDTYPGYLHYRITAIMNDGSKVYSEVQTVRIVRNH